MVRSSKTPAPFDAQGRVLIPDDIRRQKGWSGGERIAVRLVDDIVTVAPAEEREGEQRSARSGEGCPPPSGAGARGVREPAAAYLARPRQEHEMALAAGTGTLDRQGRVLIPAEVRREKGWTTGERVVVRLVDGDATVMTPREAVRMAQEVFMQGIPPGVSLVDELIAERRAAAARGD